ncbi:helix-turn-helix domain-containing protein [Allokutzneria sp. A3M-2-11 16]|uniref:ArsR/SmtB family transcription factor n=1 Tax=Allokutzneria sp. A3M-2-11 16 TaxID=2962043 RepID=UPI0020B8649F|nr:helix-turn-helix domain-containing protein [Allokutzneria sp. A3M-2-11 16]MCP3803841.1 helix-turn-helix domain-containing protein [Allokutzneria sp. A3M-2-11 16]
MLRIHFEADDLARVRVLDAPDPLWETLLSVHMLQKSDGEIPFGQWRSRVRSQATPSVRLLTTLAPARGYSADFLTPTVGAKDLTTALDRLLNTSGRFLHEDVSELASEQPLPTPVKRLATGDSEVLGLLDRTVRHYFSYALQPYWNTMTAQINADRQTRFQAMLGSGVEGVLNHLHPSVRWRSPTLEVDYPVEQDLHLGGRGLTLVPSFFCWKTPVTLKDANRDPVLVYPVERTPGWSDPALRKMSGTRSLVALLGKTRAVVLEAIAARPGVSTTELAVRLAISPAGASQHATVLRDAGLIVTQRRGGSALHSITGCGLSLLEAASR